MQKAFSTTLAVMCIGALLMIGLSLSAPRASAPVRHIADLAKSMRDASVFAISAILALFLGTVIAFIIVEKRQSGSQRIFRMPTRVPGWVRILSLALVLLAFVAATYTPPTDHPEPEPEPESNDSAQKAPVQSVEEPQPEYTPTPEPPLVVPPKVTPWPWWKYALAAMAIIFIVVMGIAIIGPRRSAVIQEPVVENLWSLAEELSIDMIELSDSNIRTIEEEPDPRIAVLMCYLAFLSALEMGGTPAEPHHTPEDCALSAEKVFSIPQRSLAGLLAAYQKAFFSTHDVTCHDKRAALASLQNLKSHMDSVSVVAVEAAGSGRG